MRAWTVAALVAAGAAAIAGGWYYGTATTPGEQTSLAGGSLMFPGLTGRLPDMAKLEITHQGKQTVIEKRPGGGWGVASLHDYPIQDTKLRGLLAGLTELRLEEPRTSDPAAYSRLGVDDAGGDLLRVLDAGGQPVAAVILGHKRVRSHGPEEVYVRRPGETQSWLAEGSVQADADASQWLDRDILNIGHDRIASVVVGDRALVFSQKDGKLTLTEPADHPKLEDYKVEDVGRALEALTLQSVKTEAPGEETGHAVFTTTDGLAVTVTLLHADKDVWARFAISGPDAVKAEADRLSARLSGWTYQIGSWKEKALVPAMDDLKVAEQPAAATPPGAATPGKAIETTTPEAASPRAAVPPTATPEPTAPLPTTPETAAPETAAPENVAPPAASPEASVPETAPSGTAAPQTAEPETEQK